MKRANAAQFVGRYRPHLGIYRKDAASLLLRGAKRELRTIRQIDFMVPGLKTVSELNQREHWGAKNRRKQDQQQLIAVAMSNALARRKVELPCVVTLTRIGPKKLDEGD